MPYYTILDRGRELIKDFTPYPQQYLNGGNVHTEADLIVRMTGHFYVEPL